MKIYESKNFIVESHERPEIDREEGGHIKISPKRKIIDRTKLSPAEAVELMRLTVICGKAMKKAMAKQGIKIGRINYQDNGNWKSFLHVHLYCQAVDAKIQKFGDPIIPGYKEEFEPLNTKDIELIKSEMVTLLSNHEFSDEKWGLSLI